jgi:hypothetical protein
MRHLLLLNISQDANIKANLKKTAQIFAKSVHDLPPPSRWREPKSFTFARGSSVAEASSFACFRDFTKKRVNFRYQTKRSLSWDVD